MVEFGPAQWWGFLCAINFFGLTSLKIPFLGISDLQMSGWGQCWELQVKIKEKVYFQCSFTDTRIALFHLSKWGLGAVVNLL